MATVDLAKKRAQSKKWKDANREKVRAAGRLYAKAHRDQANAWKAANRPKVNAGERRRRELNPEYFKDYYRDNVARIKNRMKESYRADPAPTKQRAKEWKLQNADRALELRQAYYRANKSTIEQRVREWNAANPEAARARGRNYRARSKQAVGSHTGADIKALFVKQLGVCIYCRTPLGDGYHVDHIQPLSRGGSNWPDNLQLTCAKCTNDKRATDPEEYARRLSLAA